MEDEGNCAVISVLWSHHLCGYSSSCNWSSPHCGGVRGEHNSSNRVTWSLGCSAHHSRTHIIASQHDNWLHLLVDCSCVYFSMSCDSRLSATMSVPAQLCSGTKEEVLASFPGKTVGEDCPLCLRAGKEVAIGFHRSHAAAAPLPPIPSTPSTTSLSQLGHIQPVNVADAQAITTANALWTAIQRVPDDPSLYSDPAQMLELPFPFPGESMPVETFRPPST